MNRRRFLLALGIMVVAPALDAAEAVTEAMSYPEPGDPAPRVPEPQGEVIEVHASFANSTYVGEQIAIIDLETGFKEFMVISEINWQAGTMTAYRS